MAGNARRRSEYAERLRWAEAVRQRGWPENAEPSAAQLAAWLGRCDGEERLRWAARILEAEAQLRAADRWLGALASLAAQVAAAAGRLGEAAGRGPR